MSLLYAGLDVSLEMTSICVIDAEGRMVCETKVISEPEAIASCLLGLSGSFERVGLEVGPLSQWLYFGHCDANLPAVCIETRHSKAAIAAMSMNKTDRNDARSLAHLVRSGWFKMAHVKSVASQELRTLLTSREFLSTSFATTRMRFAVRSGPSGSRWARSPPPALPSGYANW